MLRYAKDVFWLHRTFFPVIGEKAMTFYCRLFREGPFSTTLLYYIVIDQAFFILVKHFNGTQKHLWYTDFEQKP